MKKQSVFSEKGTFVGTPPGKGKKSEWMKLLKRNRKKQKEIMKTSFTIAAMAASAFTQIDNSPAIVADRIARTLQEKYQPDVFAGRHPHVAYAAYVEAKKAGLPPELVMDHPVVAGMAALERLA